MFHCNVGVKMAIKMDSAPQGPINRERRFSTLNGGRVIFRIRQMNTFFVFVGQCGISVGESLLQHLATDISDEFLQAMRVFVVDSEPKSYASNFLKNLNDNNNKVSLKHKTVILDRPGYAGCFAFGYNRCRQSSTNPAFEGHSLLDRFLLAVREEIEKLEVSFNI
jgi:hypothetical protein